MLYADLVNQAFNRYFQINGEDASPKKLQTGIVRTNCMDNLDRTNVVQAAVAKYTLNQQLRALGILSADDGVDDYEAFSKEFRESKFMALYISFGSYSLQCGPIMQTTLQRRTVALVL